MFAIVFLLYLFGFIGAGDGKLLLAITALKGLPFSLGVTIYAILIGALISVYYNLKDKSFSDSWKRFVNNIKEIFLTMKINKTTEKAKIPVKFAIAIFIGTAVEWVVPFIDTMFKR
jgi:prepilin peptidase CpaA